MRYSALLALILTLGLTGCSREDADHSSNDNDHIWQSQTDALREAQQMRDTQKIQTERQQQLYDQLDQESRGQ
jgi:outer membrane biogenesis lipoprotein LolB